MKIEILAHTTYDPHVFQDLHDFEPDPMGSAASSLAEAAGRACYQSWSRPNPATSTNEGYLANIIDHKHLSTFEHGTVTFLFTGVSRALTHELVRHRHFSYSQLSQRYCPNTEGYVTPPLFEGNEEWQREARRVLDDLWEYASTAYDQLVAIAETRGVKRKQARESARAVLPNMTGTQIVVSGNHRSWREFIQKRATVHADAEIRELAVEVFRQLSALEPNLYQDGQIEIAYEHLTKPEVVVWS